MTPLVATGVQAPETSGSTRAPTLREYQDRSIAAVRAEYVRGIRSTLLVLPTGAGKTVVAAEIIRRAVERGGRVLFVAHRTELLEQTVRKLAAVGVEARLEKAQHRAGAAPVVVASVQTLKGARLEAFAPDAFVLVVVDECHRVMAKTYRAILDRFAGARVLGLTATPMRVDGKPLGDVFETCAFRYELRAAIRDGWLAPLVARRIELDSVDLSAVPVRQGDLAADELAAIMGTERTLHATAIPLLEQSGTRRTVAFCVDRAHATALTEVLNRYQPGVARALDGDTDDEVRRRTLAEFRAGEFRVLVNVALFVEGWDEPSIGCIAMCRPTQSWAFYVQCIGRGSRLSPETGKRDCLILDFSGSSRRLGLVGPADVLAGIDLDDEVRAEVERRTADGAEDLDVLLDDVERNGAARADQARVRASAKYLAEEVDPFIGADEHELSGDPRPATIAQRTLLTKLMTAKGGKRRGADLPDGLTAETAASAIARLQRREAFRLASYATCRLLRSHGIDPRNLTAGDAGRKVAELRAVGFKRRAMRQGRAA